MRVCARVCVCVRVCATHDVGYTRALEDRVSVFVLKESRRIFSRLRVGEV